VQVKIRRTDLGKAYRPGRYICIYIPYVYIDIEIYSLKTYTLKITRFLWEIVLEQTT